MKQTSAPTLVLLVLLATSCALAQGVAGVYTDCYYGGSRHADDSVICWSKAPGGAWQHYTTAWTEWQSWPEDGRLRWGHTSLSDPKVVVDTNRYYIFYAKSYISGAWKYSSWSTQGYYQHPTDYFARTLNLTLTSPPNPPPQD